MLGICLLGAGDWWWGGEAGRGLGGGGRPRRPTAGLSHVTVAAAPSRAQRLVLRPNPLDGNHRGNPLPSASEDPWCSNFFTEPGTKVSHNL